MFLTMKHRPHHSNKNRDNKGPKRDNSRRGERPQQRYESSEQPRGPRAALFGFHAVREAWLNPERKIHALYIDDLKEFEPVLQEAQAMGLRRPQPAIVDKAKIDQMTPKGSVHQGIALACAPLEEVFLQDFIIKSETSPDVMLVMLDQVTDPHNVGAIMRTASAFGAAGLIMQKKHAPELDGVLAKSACGAVEHLPVAYETNLSRSIEQLKEAGFFVFGFDEHTNKDISQIKPGGKVVLVFGSEGDGIRRLVKEHCDELVKLPTQGAIQSLNVSNAAAIALYALAPKKQR